MKDEESLFQVPRHFKMEERYEKRDENCKNCVGAGVSCTPARRTCVHAHETTLLSASCAHACHPLRPAHGLHVECVVCMFSELFWWKKLVFFS